MTSLLRAARRLLVLAVATSLALTGALPAHADEGFIVEGQVIFPDGYPHEKNRYPRVRLSSTTDDTDGTSPVGPDGRFAVKVPRSDLTYRLQFADSSDMLYGGWLRTDGSISDDSDVPQHTFSSSATITLRPKLTSMISGVITRPAGLDPADSWQLNISSYVLRGTEWVSTGPFSGVSVSPGKPFEIWGLDAGETHRFVLNDSYGTFAPGLFGDGTIVDNYADALHVVPPASGIVITPVLASSIRGRVTVPAGVDLDELNRESDVRMRWAYSDDPDFRSHRTARVNSDGTYEIRGLWSDSAIYVGVETVRSGTFEPGIVTADGTLTLDVTRARVVQAGDSDVNMTARLPIQFSGTVELPEGTTRSNRPHVWLTPATKEIHGMRWSATWGAEVAEDGSFTTGRAHSRSEFRLQLRWPDGRETYWTSNYTLPTEDVGKATLVRPGTPIVFPSSNKMVALTSPSISGDARVGATLRADGGTWSAPSPTLTYQWLRSGKPITGATSPTYRAKGADVGSRLAARVTAAAPGFPKVSATSPQSAVVAKVTPKVKAKVLAKGTTRSKVRMRVNVDAAGAIAKLTGTLRIKYGKKTRTVKVNAKHQGKRTIKIARTKARGKITVRFTPTKASAKALTTATGSVKVTKVALKVKVKTPKKASPRSRAKVTVRLKTPLTSKPTGKIRVRYGTKTRTVTLKAKNKGKVTVRLPRLSKGKHTIRATYTPAKKWRPYFKKTTTRTTLRVR